MQSEAVLSFDFDANASVGCCFHFLFVSAVNLGDCLSEEKLTLALICKSRTNCD